MFFTSWPPIFKIFFLTTIAVIYSYYYISFISYLIKLVGVVFAIVHISWWLTQIINNYSQRTLVSPLNKAVVITGCDSGFGLLAAKALDSYGFNVFAGCTNPKGPGAQKLYKSTSNRLRILYLDVTKKSTINEAIREINECDLKLWALINCSDTFDIGNVELGNSVDRTKKIFELNLFGAINVVETCLPSLRESHGRVVNVLSSFGRFTFSGVTPYSMSKHALRSLNDGLRRELSSLDIKVIGIEPLLYTTDSTNEERLAKELQKIWSSSNKEVREAYGDTCKYQQSSLVSKLNSVSQNDLTDVVDAIEDAVVTSNPNLYYHCSALWQRILFYILEQMAEIFQDSLLTQTNLVNFYHFIAYGLRGYFLVLKSG